MNDGYNMPNGEYRRHGSLWLHISESELIWACAAAASVGLILGIVITLWSISGGTQ